MDRSWRSFSRVFLKLGMTSFGGPIAHLGYFRDEIVVRRKRLDEMLTQTWSLYASFCQDQASSQVGFSLCGVLRGNGLLGGLAAAGSLSPCLPPQSCLPSAQN